ncbi:hypothetical protein GCM10023169_15070 [Georgenia halophila]|uniref:YoaR-like putative peptidoglycan binding domain-containing protein n=1 Tax=Georgenia halophila TaxID=620889 RepID=A0ABP8L462_9MICO
MTDDRTPGEEPDTATPETGDPAAGTGMSDLDTVLDRRQRGLEEPPPPPPASDGNGRAVPSGDRGGQTPHDGADDGAAQHEAERDVTTDPDATAVVPAVGDEPHWSDPASDPATTAAASPFAGFEEEKPRRGRRRALIALVVLIVLAAAYGGAAMFLGERVPNGTTVAGVPVGGMTHDAARERLEQELGPVAAEQVPVAVGEEVAGIDPGETGMTFDAEATVDDLVGFTLDPQALWGHLFGLGAVEPATTVDEPALREALQGVADELDVAPVQGAIAFSGTTIDVTQPEPGTAVDVDAAVEAVEEGWLTEERPLQLPTEEVAPEIGADAVEEARTSLAEPLVSAPVTVKVGDKLAELSPEQLATHATFVAEGSSLELQLDGEGLADTVVEVNPEIEVTGEDAQIILGNDGPEIVPSTTGKGLDPEQLAESVLAAGTSGERTAEVELVASEPDFTTEDAEALGVDEVISEFSTPMPYNPVRTENLQVGAAKASGTLLRPGEEFSLLKAIGPITASNGYVSSGVVEDGFVSEALGGGLSQLSTTLYNVGYLAGMDDVAHTPHSRWFDRYPMGREATLWEPSTDMIWRNNTDYGVLVQAWVTDDRVHARLWGTDVWDVESRTSDPYNIVQPETVYNPSDQCEPESGGQNGFTVTVTRQRFRDGSLFDEETWTWTYSPWNHVVCGAPPSDRSSGDGSSGDSSGGGD